MLIYNYCAKKYKGFKETTVFLEFLLVLFATFNKNNICNLLGYTNFQFKDFLILNNSFFTYYSLHILNTMSLEKAY